MARIAIITSYFPFGEPEQFFQPELAEWAASDNDVVLLPMRSSGTARKVPTGITLDTSLGVLDTWRRRGTPLALLRAFTSPSVWSEVRAHARTSRSPLRSTFEILSTEAQIRYLTPKLMSAAERADGFDVVYAYWHGVGAYAAAAAKTKGAKIGSVIARAHRVDLYEEHRHSGHHPRKRTYGPLIDVNAAISHEGADYLVERYQLPPNRVTVARLGCDISDRKTPPSARSGEFHILSASFVTPVKRVPWILEAVRRAAALHPNTRVFWTHLGGGPQFEALTREATESLPPNMTVSLPGQVDHSQVLQYLDTEIVDVFVNASTSEGIPVSIMEAMAGGVPVIAPAVGGVAELVDDSVGVLLEPDFSVDELSEAISTMRTRSRDSSLRERAATKVSEHYNATKNFRAFIGLIQELPACDRGQP